MAYQTYTLVLLNSESEDQRMLTSNKLHAEINKTDKAQKFILTLNETFGSSVELKSISLSI
ncbi:MAG: hypothetical protein RL662_1439 [Bacteroidota bacterium]